MKNDQSPDGSWKYPFEAGISTDAFTIILLRTLEIEDEELIKGLAARILSRQVYIPFEVIDSKGKKELLKDIVRR